MELLLDPTIWAGLATLVVLEIVLGIDNLIFIAILSDKLPPEQRQKARVIGLSLALGMRLILLASLSWIISLTTPAFTALNHDVSWRDLIMLLGGGFLLFKGTMELHEKLEGARGRKTGPVRYAQFWPVIIQIIILDAVFSMDAVITAVGMTEHLPVMMIAVVIAMILMIIASKALMDFVSQHPTVVILCLGFLLMIGFSLMVEGLGYHIPKGYLYAAIGFSVLIEVFNQLAQHNRVKSFRKIDARTRVSEAVIGLLGFKSAGESGIDRELSGIAPQEEELSVFKPQERFMIRRVLQLAEQPVRAIMTPRHELYWIDLNDDEKTIAKDIRECPYSCMVVARDGSIDEPLGIIFKKDLADLLLQPRSSKNFEKAVRQPIAVPDVTTVLQTMDAFQKSRIHVAFVIDEYGSLEGLVTLTDVVEAIAGDMPEDHEEDAFQQQKLGENAYLINGNLTIQQLQEVVGHLENLPEGDYNTVAGIALNVLRRLPKKGDKFKVSGWIMTIQAMDGRRVSRIKMEADLSEMDEPV